MSRTTELADLYTSVDTLVTEAKRLDVLPRDIADRWPNILGFLRRVPNQPYYREAPNGRDDTPSATERRVFGDLLALYQRRLSARIREKMEREPLTDITGCDI